MILHLCEFYAVSVWVTRWSLHLLFRLEDFWDCCLEPQYSRSANWWITSPCGSFISAELRNRFLQDSRSNNMPCLDEMKASSREQKDNKHKKRNWKCGCCFQDNFSREQKEITKDKKCQAKFMSSRASFIRLKDSGFFLKKETQVWLFSNKLFHRICFQTAVVCFLWT